MPPWYANDTLLIVATVLSVLMFLGTMVAVPIICIRLPEDYFIAPIPKRPRGVVYIRTLFAVFLIAVGVAMLVLPGQGMLTILVGISLLDFPAKRRLERRILSNRTVFSALNRLRKTRGKPPFLRH